MQTTVLNCRVHALPTVLRQKNTDFQEQGKTHKHSKQHFVFVFVQYSRSVLAMQDDSASSDPPNALTKFIRNTEARVFADMHSAPLQEMNEKYRLPAEGRPDIPNV